MSERDPNEIGALWLKRSKNGRPFLSGTIGGQEVVCFEIGSDNPKAPKWRVLKSQPRDDGAASRRQYDQREAPRRSSRVDDIEREDGF